MIALNYHVDVAKLSDADGGGWSATVPDLPGCMSDGATEFEARNNARDAIAAWIERAQQMGRPIPKPSSERQYA